MPSRGGYTRPVGQRRYRRLFVLSTEGTNTEPQYFAMFNDENTTIRVRILRNRGSDPKAVLREMKRFLEDEGLRKGDAAWLVVDKDSWLDQQLQGLCEWARQDDRYGLAVSNPKFEYWLLLHFEDGDGIQSPRDCTTRLRRHLPDYDKNLQPRDLQGRTGAAVSRAEQRDTPRCVDWPGANGTTVYRLVQDLTRKEQ